MNKVHLGKGRLEAFSDGVIAIIITIMVLELKTPHGYDLAALEPTLPIFINYVLSFIYVGIYWNNHHHTMHIIKSINGGILWANMHLLFWLSMVPFVTAWMGESHFQSPAAVAMYGVVLLMNAIAYTILMVLLIKHEGSESLLAHALGKDCKGKISIVFYLTAIAAAWINTWISFALYITVAIIWFMPDKRIEKIVAETKHQ
jgi:uncharacterized membrane protein